MSLIICACDLGLTDTINMGAVEAIDCGCVSTASVLLNMPGTEHALAALSERPWISYLWQICERGRTVSSKTETELEQELREELLNAVRLAGKAPCAALIDSPRLYEAAVNVCTTFAVRTDWLDAADARSRMTGESGSGCPFALCATGTGRGVREIRPSEKGLGFDSFSEYDPLSVFNDIPQDNGCYFVRMYPGFLDDVSLAMTIDEERNVHRIADQRLLCSEDFRKELTGKYRLISLEDAFTGRKDFANHGSISGKNSG